jgi:cytochrome P450
MAIEDRFGCPAIVAEPLEYFGELRAEAPVFYSDSLKGFVVSRYETLQYVVGNPEIFSSSPVATAMSNAGQAKQYQPIYEELGTPPPLATLLITDGAVHKRYRGAVEAAFSAGAVAAMETGIRTRADAIIDDFIDRERVDLLTEFCQKLPAQVMCDLIGLSRDQADILRNAATAAVRLISSALETEESRRELHRQRAEMHVYVQRLIERFRREPIDNLLSKLVHLVPDDGVPLNDAELISLVVGLNVGGNETTVNGLGGMFLSAFRTPDVQAKLRDGTMDTGRFVEEALRLETPVAAMPRWATRDSEVEGVSIPAGSLVYVSFLSANHDEARFACPAHVDTQRKGIRNHAAFGAGVHYCLGAVLARLEMKVALERVLDRLAGIQLDDTAPPVEHHVKFIARGIMSLPIRFKRREAMTTAAAGHTG